MGPLQACGTYGIGFTLAPPEFFPSWTGLGSHGPLEFIRAHLGLASWLLALIVFPVVGSRLYKAQWRRWRPKAWAYAAMAGTALADAWLSAQWRAWRRNSLISSALLWL